MPRRKKKQLPFVSVCTPTFNRRPFIPYMIKCFKSQTYPLDRIEWIIIDDGTDKVEDLIKEADLPQIKYFKYDEKIPLGKKRNLMHEKTSGDIIVYMDDDDYYPPTRIKHSVETLMKNPDALCAGSSIIHVYFKHIKKIIEFGPYGPNHATAGTFAFRRELLNQTSYEESAALAEEKHFLKNYTIPFVQLDPKQTILVFSHLHNTFDKKNLLKNPNPLVTKESKIQVKDFIESGEIRDFYMTRIENLLKKYDPGDPKHKPDVAEQMKSIEKQRDQLIRDNMLNSPSIITIMDENGQQRNLKNGELIDVLKSKDKQIEELNKRLKEGTTSISLKQNGENRQLSNDEIISLIQQLQKQTNDLTMENNLLKEKINILEQQNTNEDISSTINPFDIPNPLEEIQTSKEEVKHTKFPQFPSLEEDGFKRDHLYA